jgi:glyoxylase-like metal-dependent hydrolase (beta-lactamase superfamily II)
MSHKWNKGSVESHNPQIHRIINSFHNSNTYVIDLNENKVALIDPGDPDTSRLKNWLLDTNKTIAAVLLTHEHADHCAGVNPLIELYNFDLYCTSNCADNIKNSKQNLSFYMDSIQSFSIDTTVISVDNESISFLGVDFQFVNTPGHSPGSACIWFDNMLFSGDTLLNDNATPLGFPHSCRKEYSISMNKLVMRLKNNTMIFPGHGEPFIYNNSIKNENRYPKS